MEYKRFGNKIVARLDKGQEIFESLTKLCKKENVKLASVTALGALSEVTIGYYNVPTKDYTNKDYMGIYEMVHLNGNVTSLDGQCYLHLHCCVIDENNNALGGHLSRAVISATCEMVIDVIDGAVDRKYNDELKMNLMEF